MRRDSGHALIETLAGFSLASLVLVGLSIFLRDQWNGARCAYLVFEAGREGLAGASVLRASLEVRVSETPTEVIAEGRCGNAVERVRFVKLENARW